MPGYPRKRLARIKEVLQTQFGGELDEAYALKQVRKEVAKKPSAPHKEEQHGNGDEDVAHHQRKAIQYLIGRFCNSLDAQRVERLYQKRNEDNQIDDFSDNVDHFFGVVETGFVDDAVQHSSTQLQ